MGKAFLKETAMYVRIHPCASSKGFIYAAFLSRSLVILHKLESATKKSGLAVLIGLRKTK